MNRRTVAAIILAVGLCTGTRIYSETPPSEAAVSAALQRLKAANQDVIQRQEKTLKMLDDLKAQAEQIKSMGKRT